MERARVVLERAWHGGDGLALYMLFASDPHTPFLHICQNRESRNCSVDESRLLEPASSLRGRARVLESIYPAEAGSWPDGYRVGCDIQE